MHADATFLIAAGHEVCQDWAAAGGLPHARWALLCDGCSGAPRSDFGARLIGQAAALELGRGHLSGSQIVERAARHAAILGLAGTCLDATLWAIWQQGELLRVFGSGDGVVVARRHDGRLEAWSVEHPDSAPAYLSYLLEPERLARYLEHHGERRLTHWVDGERLGVTETHVARAPYAMSWTFERDRYASVAVMSDGVGALRDEDRRRVPLPEALAVLLDFKRLRGRFVLRRLRAAIKRRCLELGDDLSMAALASPHAPEAVEKEEVAA